MPILSRSWDSPHELADAFSAFIAASASLEGSYRSLQLEVERLGSELVECNSALRSTLAENEQISATLQQMMDSLPCGVLALDGCHRIVMINPAGRSLLNLGGAAVEDLDDLARCSNLEWRELSCRDGDAEAEIPLQVGPDTRWLGLSRHKIKSATADEGAKRRSRDIRHLWVLRNITAVKQAERERERARNAVALAEISTVLAHEIRNPLASMELFAGLMVDEPARSGEWVMNLRAGIRLLSATVNNVLGIGCDVGPGLAPIELSASVRGGVEFVRPIAEQARVSLSFTAEAEDLFVLGKEEAIQQVVLNLVCNAIRHTPGGGHIAIQTERVRGTEKDRARIRVADSGCGITAELLDHVFDPGFSGDGCTPGLGLAVCRKLMSQHGGTITVSSWVGVGTEFELEFPCL